MIILRINSINFPFTIKSVIFFKPSSFDPLQRVLCEVLSLERKSWFFLEKKGQEKFGFFSKNIKDSISFKESRME